MVRLDLTHLWGKGGSCEVKPIKRNGAAPVSCVVDRLKPASGLSGERTPEDRMLNLDQHMDIKHLSRQGHSIRAIARMTGHSHNTVRKVLSSKQAPVFKASKRGSMLDPYKDYLKKRIEECNLSGLRLLEEIRGMGYRGGYTTLKVYLARIRPRRGKLTVRYETPPGEQAQCDWGYCGRYTDTLGVRIIRHLTTLGDGATASSMTT